jgi:hypothetical protein
MKTEKGNVALGCLLIEGCFIGYFFEIGRKTQALGFLSDRRIPEKGKGRQLSLPFFSISIKSIARRLLPSRACVPFLFTSTKIMHTK